MKKIFLLLNFIFQSIIFISCSNIKNIPVNKMGGVYGQIEVYPYVAPRLVKLNLCNNIKILHPDSSGIFFIDSVNAGTHCLNISIPALGDFTSRNFNVASDSITILYFGQINKSKGKFIDCDTTKVIKSNPLKYGNVAGYVYNLDKKPISNARIIVYGIFWNTITDSTGFFHINKILQGEYIIRSTKDEENSFAKSKVIIYPDITTYINLVIKPERIE